MNNPLHFSIAHRLKARLRIQIPALKRDAQRLSILAMLLYKHAGIKKVKTVAAIASVTIEVIPEQLSIDQLLPLLDRLIGNLGQASSPSETSKRPINRSHDEHIQTLFLGIQGMTCRSCAAYLELLLQKQPNVLDVRVDYFSASAYLRGDVLVQEVLDLVQGAGYLAYRLDSMDESRQLLQTEFEDLQQTRQRLKTALLFSLPIAVIGMMNIRSKPLLGLQALLTAQTLFRQGQTIFMQGWRSLRKGSANMYSLVALGAGSAYIYSLPALFRSQAHVYFGSAAAIIDFVLIGQYLELSAKTQMIRNIERLVEQFPQTVVVLKDHQEHRVRLSGVNSGDVVLIQPGAIIPIDGMVIKGLSNVDESPVNGQSLPCIKESGQQVFAGSVNGSGILQIQVTGAGKDTGLEKQMTMRHQAAIATQTLQNRADHYAAVLIPGIFGVSVLTLTGWLIKGASVAHALANALAVLMISCPCALGLATPAATTVGYSRSAKRNIYIRHGEAFPVLQQIDTFVFDQTGTLTQRFDAISDMVNISSLSDAEWKQWAAALAQNADPVLYRVLMTEAGNETEVRLDVSRFVYLPDQGMKANIKGHVVMLGHRRWMQKHQVNINELSETAETLERQGKTVFFMAIDQTLAGVLAVVENIRPEAFQVIESLQQKNIQSWMVSGESVLTVETLAAQLPLNHWQAECDPAQKLKIIRKLQQQGQQVAMVGEGIKNAPALQAADVSLSLGQSHDMAILSADFVLPDQDLHNVSKIMRISRDTLQNVNQNLGLAFVYNALAIPLAMSGRLSPVIASGAMALSSLSILLNSLRLMNKPAED